MSTNARDENFQNEKKCLFTNKMEELVPNQVITPDTFLLYCYRNSAPKLPA